MLILNPLKKVQKIYQNKVKGNRCDDHEKLKKVHISLKFLLNIFLYVFYSNFFN
jgi:hypothetical protein